MLNMEDLKKVFGESLIEVELRSNYAMVEFRADGYVKRFSFLIKKIGGVYIFDSVPYHEYLFEKVLLIAKQLSQRENVAVLLSINFYFNTKDKYQEFTNRRTSNDISYFIIKE